MAVEFCDLDHVAPFNKGDPTRGGPTCEANLMCLCRSRHRFKTFHSWRYLMTADGTLTVVTESGLTLTTVPSGPVAERRERAQDAGSAGGDVEWWIRAGPDGQGLAGRVTRTRTFRRSELPAERFTVRLPRVGTLHVHPAGGVPSGDMSSREPSPRPGSVRPGATPVTTSLARVLDDLVTVPGTRFRVGIDPVIGLVPVIGDALGALVAAVVLGEAVRNRVPIHVLFRMGWNYLVDALLGLVPLVGDVADAAHKATSKNLRLLEKTLAEGKAVDTNARGYVARALGAVGLVLLVLLGLAGLAIWGLLKVFNVV